MPSSGRGPHYWRALAWPQYSPKSGWQQAAGVASRKAHLVTDRNFNRPDGTFGFVYPLPQR